MHWSYHSLITSHGWTTISGTFEWLTGWVCYPSRPVICNVVAECKTVVTLLLMQWSYHSLIPSHGWTTISGTFEWLTGWVCCPSRPVICYVVAECKTVVTLLLVHWSYHSLITSHGWTTISGTFEWLTGWVCYPSRLVICNVVAECKTVVTLLLMQWSYHSLIPSHGWTTISGTFEWLTGWAVLSE